MNSGFARSQRAEPRRKGGILVLFAMLTFVFMAVAAVVIDIGLANLTQAQMQAAADTAALEGCRWRNFDEGLGDSHAEKRRKAATLVRLAFDDDLYPTQGVYRPENGSPLNAPDDRDERNISAGPGLRVSGGSGAWAANAILDQHPDSELARLDDPRLQTNNGNEAHGDMVAGHYLPEELHLEPGSYVRPDFTTATDGPGIVSALSFLVRMRRSGDSSPLDVQNGVSSSLPTLPVVFGLGSTILADPDGNGWDPRRDGITVRATAIASARPAMRIGRAPCDSTGGPLWDHEPDVGTSVYRERIGGLAPFFIYRETWVEHFRVDGWQATSVENEGRVRVEADGRIVLDNDPSTLVGHFLFDAASDPGPCGEELGWPDTVGRAVTPVTSSPVRSFRFTKRKPTYIAIVEPIMESTGTVLRVVGYGYAHLWPVGYDAETEPPPPDYDGSGLFVISPGELINHVSVRCWVAQDNASAILKSAAHEAYGVPLSASTLRQVLTWSNRLAYGVDEPDPERIYDYTYIQRGTVLAPALTR